MYTRPRLTKITCVLIWLSFVALAMLKTATIQIHSLVQIGHASISHLPHVHHLLSKGNFTTQLPTGQPTDAPTEALDFVDLQGLQGKSLQLATIINKLHASRIGRTNATHWGIPLYLVTLGGPRLEQFKKEMAAEGQSFVVVPQSEQPLDSDYPELKNTGVMKCTRAHLSFA